MGRRSCLVNKPWLGESQVPEAKPMVIVLLNAHIVKLPSKYLLLYNVYYHRYIRQYIATVVTHITLGQSEF